MIANFALALMASAEVMKSHDKEGHHNVEAYYQVTKTEYIAGAEYNLRRNKEAAKLGIESHKKDSFKKKAPLEYSEENIEGSLVITCPEEAEPCESGCCIKEYVDQFVKCEQGSFYGGKCWVPSSFAYECPADYQLIGDRCVIDDVVPAEILCPSNFVYVPEEDLCVTTVARDGLVCPPEYELVDDLCVAYEELEPVCPDGYELVDETECVRVVESEKCLNGHGKHLRRLGEKDAGKYIAKNAEKDAGKYASKHAEKSEAILASKIATKAAELAKLEAKIGQKLDSKVKSHKVEKVLSKITPRAALPTPPPKFDAKKADLAEKKAEAELKKIALDAKKEELKAEKEAEIIAKKAELEYKKTQKRDELREFKDMKDFHKRMKTEELRRAVIRKEEEKALKKESWEEAKLAKKELEAAKKEAIEAAKADKKAKLITEKYAYEAWIKVHPKSKKDVVKDCTYVEVVGATQPVVEVIIPPVRGEVPENLVAEPSRACPVGYLLEGNECYYTDVTKQTRLCDGLVVGNKECRTEAVATRYCPKGWELEEDQCLRYIDVMGTWTWIRGFQCTGTNDTCAALYEFIKTDPHHQDDKRKSSGHHGEKIAEKSYKKHGEKHAEKLVEKDAEKYGKH